MDMLPFPEKFKNQEFARHIPIVDPVVTTRDYESAWKSDDVYNFTMGPQIHLLRHYTVLFIGFSFRDKWVNDLLRKLNEERESRMKRQREDEEDKGKNRKKKKERKYRLYHYAIMREDEINAREPNFFKDLGVNTIPIKDFPQIKDILSHLYQQALLHDYQGSTRIKLPFYEGRSKNKQDKAIFSCSRRVL